MVNYKPLLELHLDVGLMDVYGRYIELIMLG